MVDDTFGRRLVGSGIREVLADELRDDDAAARERSRSFERPCQQLELRKRRRFVDLDEDLAGIRSRLDEVGGETESLRGRVRILESARVRDERRVERLGDRRRELQAEQLEDVGEHLSRGRRVGHDQVDVAEARVVVVVVDVDGQRRRGEQRRLGDAALLGAIECDENAFARIGGRLAEQPVLLEPEEPVLGRRRRGAAHHHHGVLAELLEGEMERHERSDRVAVRVVVRGEDEPVVLAQRSGDRTHVIRFHRRLRRPAQARR